MVKLSLERLLIDEATGRAIVQQLGLNITGVLDVLLIAKQQKLISAVKTTLDALVQQVRFRVSPALYQSVFVYSGRD